MPTLADLRPGDIGFANRVQPWEADALIEGGQWLLSRLRKPHHAFVVVEAAVPDWGGAPKGLGPRIVQAMPSGAEEVEIGAQHWTKDYVYVRPPYALKTGHTKQEGYVAASAGVLVAQAARLYKDVPYGFLDYASILGVHMGVKNGPIRQRVKSGKTMICSQLADQALTDAGFHVFDDDRWPGDVMPAELYARLVELGATVIRP